MKTIHHVVDIDAQPDRVWAALTGLTDLAGWWSTKVEEAGGSGVGSRLNWTFAGDFNPVMEITAIRDGAEVECTSADTGASVSWRPWPGSGRSAARRSCRAPPNPLSCRAPAS